MTSFTLRLLCLAALWPATVLAAERVNQYSTNDQQFPAVAASASGLQVIVWDSVGQDGSLSSIYGRLYRADGSPAGDEFPVNDDARNRQTFPAVAMATDGRFVVAWNSNGRDGAGLGVQARRFAADGAPLGPEFQVHVDGEGAVQPGVGLAMDPQGNFVVAWADRRIPGNLSSLDTRTIQARRYDAAGQPLGRAITVASSLLPSVRGPSVGMDAAGGFVVSWIQGPSGLTPAAVRARRIGADGRALGLGFTVSQPDAQVADVDRAKIAVGASGSFVVTWESFAANARNAGVWARVYRADGRALSPQFRTPDTLQRQPAATMDDAGGFTIAAHGEGIHLQHYAADGGPLGPPLRADDAGAPHTNLLAAVADGADGSLRVVWQDYRLDGDSRGIATRRYPRP